MRCRDRKKLEKLFGKQKHLGVVTRWSCVNRGMKMISNGRSFWNKLKGDGLPVPSAEVLKVPGWQRVACRAVQTDSSLAGQANRGLPEVMGRRMRVCARESPPLR